MDYKIISKIYLASKSPRRRELLAQMKVDYSVLAVDVAEEPQLNESYLAYSQRVCQAKAAAAWAYMLKQNLPPLPILSADTEVILADKILGKPADYAAAFQMLKSLSGQKHLVLTSICLKFASFNQTLSSFNWVYFDQLTEDDITSYLQQGDYIDKAGAYGIQGYAGQFIQKIDGCFYAVMGLPLNLVKNLLTELAANYAD